MFDGLGNASAFILVEVNWTICSRHVHLNNTMGTMLVIIRQKKLFQIKVLKVSTFKAIYISIAQLSLPIRSHKLHGATYKRLNFLF